MNQFFRRRNPQRYKRWGKNQQLRDRRPKLETGFTLVETLVVIVLVGILMSILAPGWLSLRSSNTLNTGQDAAFQAIRQTQIQAINSRQTWRVGFREVSNQVEWATYAATSSPNATSWQPLLAGVRIAPEETTLSQNDSIYFVEFNHKGYVTPPYGRLSLASSLKERKRRCIFVSTLLGALRKASDAQCY